MVKTRMLNIIYIEPADMFYPGVLLRTAYSALGDRLRKFLIVSRKKINIGDLARYSRLPLRKFREIVSIRNENVDVRPDIIVSPDADKVDREILGRIEKLKERENITIVIDERGIMKNIDATYFNTGTFNHPAYEAVSLLYILYIRDLAERSPTYYSQVIEDVDYGELIYFMRNLSSSILSVDNYPILDPRTVVYTLRHVFRNHGLFLDIANVSIDVDYLDGRVIEKIEVDIYRYKSLEYVRSDEIKFDGYSLDTLFISRRGEIIRIVLNVDPDRRKICLRPDICVSSEESEEPERALSLFLTNFKA